MLHASTLKQSTIFKIHKFIDLHTCSVDFRCSVHWHATSSIVSKHILGRLDNPKVKFDPTINVHDIERELSIKFSHNKAHMEKVTVLRLLYGTTKDNFQKLSSYCHVLGEKLPLYFEVDSCNRFRYFFLTFGIRIFGYLEYLRPIICVEENYLRGPYKDTLLLATVQDAYKQI